MERMDNVRLKRPDAPVRAEMRKDDAAFGVEGIAEPRYADNLRACVFSDALPRRYDCGLDTAPLKVLQGQAGHFDDAIDLWQECLGADDYTHLGESPVEKGRVLNTGN